MILVTVNGRQKEFKENLTLKNIIDAVISKTNFLVVEYNSKIIKEDEWEKIIVQNNDNIELITFVGGG